MYIKDVYLTMTDCDIIYLDLFVWDAQKAEDNIKKHKVDFKTACRVFNDPALFEVFDEKNSVEEARFNIIGCVGSDLLLFVTTVYRDRIRIISARKATSNERRLYDENAQRLFNY